MRGCCLLMLLFTLPFLGLSQSAAPAPRDQVLQHLEDVFGAPGKQGTAIKSIKAMGTNAIPILIEILGYKASQSDQWYEKAYAKAPSAIQSVMSKPEALEKLQSEASLLLLNMPETRLYMTNLLVLLQDQKVETRRRAASLISHHLNKRSRDMDERLILDCLPALKDSDPRVRLSITHVFAYRERTFPRVKAALEAVVNDPVEEVRLEAATVLLLSDENNQSALQTLKGLFTSANASNRYLAAARYLTINSPSGRLEDEMLPIFISTLSGSDRELQIGACHCLQLFGPRGKAAVPVLVKHLKTTDTELQQAAQKALEKIAPLVLHPVKP